MRRPPRLSASAVLFALLAPRPPRATAELFCSLEYGVDGSAIGLGAAALNAMRFAEGQSASYLQASERVSQSWLGPCPGGIQGSAKRQSPGLVNFIPAVAFHFWLALPTAFTQPGARLLAEPCILRN